MANGASQMFARIEMTEPVERSIQVVTLNSFDIYLKDLDEGRWYFIPENSDTDTGPLEDIMPLPFMALGFAVVPAESLEPVEEGYVWKTEDPSWGAITASYDQEYVLKGVVRADANGREILRASFFGLNEPHDILPHEKGELLPDTYWESQPDVRRPHGHTGSHGSRGGRSQARCPGTGAPVGRRVPGRRAGSRRRRPGSRFPPPP